jgi:hypothetical protein
MGTRATVHIYEGAIHLVSIYNQWDGYPDGLGVKLAEFILSGKLVNGIPLSSVKDPTLYFNGAGCFAAQLIAKLKTEPGSIYITTEDDSQEFDYYIQVPTQAIDDVNKAITIACRGSAIGSVTTTPRPAKEFLAWAKTAEEDGYAPGPDPLPNPEAQLAKTFLPAPEPELPPPGRIRPAIPIQDIPLPPDAKL